MLFTNWGKYHKNTFLGNIHAIQTNPLGPDFIVFEKKRGIHHTAMYVNFESYRCPYQLVCPD